MLLIALNFEGKACPPFPPNSFTQFLDIASPILGICVPNNIPDMQDGSLPWNDGDCKGNAAKCSYHKVGKFGQFCINKELKRSQMTNPLLSLVRQVLRRECSKCAGPIETSQTWDPTPKTDLPTKQLQGAMFAWLKN
jgi:hypothetical protein